MLKKFLIILFLKCICVSAQEHGASLNRLDWMLGTWERQNGKPGEVHLEKWWKISENELKGIGVVMAGKDTVFVENLGIKMENGQVFYIAEVSENQSPVHFEFTKWNDNAFVSENPEHDAPKRIAYSFDGKLMTADVSWDDGGFKALFLRKD